MCSMDSGPPSVTFVAAWTLSGKHRARIFSVDPHVHNWCCSLEGILLHHSSATAQRVKPWLQIGADESLRVFEQPWAAPTRPYRASASPRCARAALWPAQRCRYPSDAHERNRTWDGSAARGIPPAPSVAPCTRALPARAPTSAATCGSPCATRSRTRCHSSAYALQQL